MNLTELRTAIQSYTENQFPEVYLADGSIDSTNNQLDRFIRQAEQRIYNMVQFPSLRKNVTGSLSLTTPYLSAPADFLAVYSMAVIAADGSYEYLLNKDVNFIRQAYPKASDVGLPKYYAIFGPTVSGTTITNELSFMMGPKPSAAFGVELHYYYYPESITTAASGTTWLGDNFDSVLLYAALVEAYTFMKGEQDLMQLYDTKFKEALMLAKRLGDGMERQDAYRSGQARIEVS